MRISRMRNTTVLTAGLAAAIALGVLSPSAQSDTPGPRIMLGPWAGDLKVGPNMNAKGKDLRGCEFVGQDLEHAIFDGCDLYGVHFWDCGLRSASFKGAHMAGVFIDECGEGLAEADFTDATVAGLRFDSVARLSPGQLMSTRSYKLKNLRECDITAYDSKNPNAKPKFDFRAAHLEGARLFAGDFSDSDFTDAHIDGIEIGGCKITLQQLASTKNFKDRNLTQMNLRVLIAGNPDFSGIDFTGTQLAVGPGRAHFKDAIINRSTIGGAFTSENLYSTKNYQQGDLSRIQFEDVDMSAWDFSRQNLTGCRFWGCTLANAKFEDAVISGLNVNNLNLAAGKGLTLEQIKSTWNYKHGRMTGVVLPKELAEALQKEKASEKKGAKE